MEPETFRKKCKGIIPVQYCTYTESGELDLDGLKENTEFLVNFAKNGDKDLVIMTNGSTTECYAMSIEEQKAVIKTVVDPEDMALINGAGELHYPGSAAYGLRYRGFVTWIGNFAPSSSYAIYEATNDGDFEGAYGALKKQLPLWTILGEFMESRETPSIIPSILGSNYMYMSVGKVCMDLTGLNGGPLRPPMEDLTEEEKSKLKELLKMIGII